MPAAFVAISWRDREPAQNAAAARLAAVMSESPNWQEASSAPGLRLWTYTDRPPPIVALQPPGSGWVIGRLFGVAPGGPAVAKGPVAAARTLVRQGWGAYVALLSDPSGGPFWILRDPSGACEGFTWRRDGIVVVANDLEGLPSPLLPARLAIDWEAVADLLVRPLSAWGRCALAQVQAIAPGEVRALGSDRPGEIVWRPADMAARPMPVTEEALVETVSDACERMAAAVGPLLVECSGGLDSSIVTAMLGHGRARGRVAAAVNQYAPQAEADERVWARAACARAGVPLLEVEKPEASIAVEDFTSLAGGARPAVSGLDAVRDRMLAEVAKDLGVGAVMTGQGGDAVFFQTPTALVAADLLRARGWRAFTDPRVPALCRWLRRSIWSVWWEALRDPPRPTSDAGHLWGPEAQAGAGPAHWWLSDLGAVPPAKQVQLEYLTFCQGKYGPSLRSRTLDVLHPLLSQPVMELCLAIPAWELVRGGRERGLARDAFSRFLPQEVAARRSKGELSTLYMRRVAASLDVLRPLLLDGALAAAGLLDRGAVDAALRPESLIRRGDGLRLLHAAAIEVWVRRWDGWSASPGGRQAA